MKAASEPQAVPQPERATVCLWVLLHASGSIAVVRAVSAAEARLETERRDPGRFWTTAVIVEVGRADDPPGLVALLSRDGLGETIRALRNARRVLHDARSDAAIARVLAPAVGWNVTCPICGSYGDCGCAPEAA